VPFHVKRRRRLVMGLSSSVRQAGASMAGKGVRESLLGLVDWRAELVVCWPELACSASSTGWAAVPMPFGATNKSRSLRFVVFAVELLRWLISDAGPDLPASDSTGCFT
jgi:hypothetical protein